MIHRKGTIDVLSRPSRPQFFSTALRASAYRSRALISAHSDAFNHGLI